MLLESLMAILILAIVGFSLMNLNQNITAGSSRLREALCAKWVIRDQISRLIITAPADRQIVTHGDLDMCDAKWQWSVSRLNVNDPRIRSYEIQAFKNEHPLAHQKVILPVR